jgi:transposase, IS5 family
MAMMILPASKGVNHTLAEIGIARRVKASRRWYYFGCARTHAQLAMAAIGQNLLKAAHKITLNPQTPAIA